MNVTTLFKQVHKRWCVAKTQRLSTNGPTFSVLVMLRIGAASVFYAQNRDCGPVLRC